MKKSTGLLRNFKRDAIPDNCAGTEEPPGPVRDLAELLAEVAVERLCKQTMLQRIKND